MQRDTGRRARIWLGFYTALSIALFALAVSNAAYEATSPAWLSFHVLLRKSYSVIAFALVGFSLEQATRFAGSAWRPARIGLCIGLYSALIEVAQRVFSGAHEALGLQAFDVACGFAGGVLGAVIADALAGGAARRGR